MAAKGIRVAVVGYGGAFNMGDHHSRYMEATGRMAVTGVCDTDPARLEAAREQRGADISVFTDLAEMVRWGGFDLAVIILPHNLHAPAALKCLQAGKHVVLEKPFCLTVREADRMIAAAREHDIMLSVFHNRRWDGDFMALREIIEAGMVGELFHVEMSSGGWSPPRGWWRDDKAISGGALFDWGAHFWDWCLQLMPGRIESVMGWAQKPVWHQTTNEDHFTVIATFENGAVADFQQSSVTRIPRPRWRLLGTLGSIVHNGDHWRVCTEVNGITAELKIPFKETDWQGYYTNIAAHVLDGAELFVKPEEARRYVALFEAAEKSAKTGRPVKPSGEHAEK